MSQNRISVLMKLLEEPEEIQQLLTKPLAGVPDRNASKVITAYHVELVRPVKLSDSDRITVLQKAAKEGLTAAQTRDVAEAFKGAALVTELWVLTGRP